MTEKIYQPSEFMHKTTGVSSRLARTEQKRLLSQAVVFAVVAVLLLVAFWFAIIPGMIRIMNAVLSPQEETINEDTLPPAPPVVAALPVATSSAQLNITGFGEAKSNVVAMVNGSENTREVIGDDGAFKLTLSLTSGENKVTFVVEDEAGNQSAHNKEYSVVIDNEAPKLELTEPHDGQQIELKKNQNLAIKGKTEPNARVYINGRLTLANTKGEFSSSYFLSEGENKLQFKVEDLAKNTYEQEIVVNFRL